MGRAGESAVPPSVESVLAALRSVSDPAIRDQMGPKYGIHTDVAYGVSMADMKAVAKPVGRDHELAQALWATGVYEARTVAAFVDEPGAVTITQMDAWCADFDNWAICDTVCFHLFDRTAGAWSRVDAWAERDPEFERRAAFALLWGLALHDKTADDASFEHGLTLIERHAIDDRHLVNKAVAMALRAIGKKHPGVRASAIAVAERLAASDDAAARRIGRPALKELGAA